MALAGGEFFALWWWTTGAGPSGSVLVHPVQGVLDAAAALAITAEVARAGATRGWAVLLLAPLTWAALPPFDQFAWPIS